MIGCAPLLARAHLRSSVTGFGSEGLGRKALRGLTVVKLQPARMGQEQEVWGSGESAVFLLGAGPWSRGVGSSVSGARVLTVEKPSHLGELFVLRARALWAQGKVTEAEVIPNVSIWCVGGLRCVGRVPTHRC